MTVAFDGMNRIIMNNLFFFIPPNWAEVLYSHSLDPLSKIPDFERGILDPLPKIPDFERGILIIDKLIRR